MFKVAYGNRTIEYTIQVKEGLKSHYISVEKGLGVVLVGREVDIPTADKLILKKAKWILEKLELVRSLDEGDIVTGSRITYLGRKYYVEVFYNPELTKAEIEFNHSKFTVWVNPAGEVQKSINEAFKEFYRRKAKEKITPRIKKWSAKTGLQYNQVKFHALEKRWGSCTPANHIIINTEAVKLPFSLIDYLLVHELCHTKVKSHSKEFWAEVSKHIGNWKELDAKMAGMKL